MEQPHGKSIWDANIDSEVDYWRGFIKARGGEWKEMWDTRMDPDREFPAMLHNMVAAEPGEDIYAIDVGSGPLTVLGSRWPGKTVHITAVDPLADQYMALFGEEGLQPPTPPQRCDGEQLLERFGPGKFHVAVAINCLDHSYDPVAAITQMVAITKPNGTVWLSHRANEAESERYQGLHQWNFDEDDGHFIIWNPKSRTDMNEVLGPRCSIQCWHDGEWLQVTIKKPGAA